MKRWQRKILWLITSKALYRICLCLKTDIVANNEYLRFCILIWHSCEIKFRRIDVHTMVIEPFSTWLLRLDEIASTSGDNCGTIHPSKKSPLGGASAPCCYAQSNILSRMVALRGQASEWRWSGAEPKIFFCHIGNHNSIIHSKEFCHRG